MYKYFKIIAGVGNGSYIYYWKSKGLPQEIINSTKTPNHSITPNLDYYGTKTRVELDGSCLKQGKVTFNHEKVVNIYIVYEISKAANISKYSSDDNYPTLQNTLIGPVSFTKKTDIDQYKYSGYGIGFDRRSEKKDILILGKDPTQGLEHTLSAEKMHSINLSKWHTKFCLSLYYNGANSYLFVNGKEIHKFKANDSEIVATPLCLGNISKDWSIDNMKRTAFNGYVYDFRVDYDAIAVDDILDLHNYLMKKNDIV